MICPIHISRISRRNTTINEPRNGTPRNGPSTSATYKYQKHSKQSESVIIYILTSAMRHSDLQLVHFYTRFFSFRDFSGAHTLMPTCVAYKLAHTHASIPPLAPSLATHCCHQSRTIPDRASAPLQCSGRPGGFRGAASLPSGHR